MNNYSPAETVFIEREPLRRNGTSSERKETNAILAEHAPHFEHLRKLAYIRDAKLAADELAKAGFSTDPEATRRGLCEWIREDRERVTEVLRSQVFEAIDKRFAPIQRRIMIRAAEQLEEDAQAARRGEAEIAKKYGAPEPQESPLVFGLKKAAEWCRGQADAPTNSGWCGDAKKALGYYFEGGL
jgi:hypothetical protein